MCNVQWERVRADLLNIHNDQSNGALDLYMQATAIENESLMNLPAKSTASIFWKVAFKTV